MIHTYVAAEFVALSILYSSGEMTMTTETDPHEAGNRIIALAERIKSERAVAAMQPHCSATRAADEP